MSPNPKITFTQFHADDSVTFITSACKFWICFSFFSPRQIFYFTARTEFGFFSSPPFWLRIYACKCWNDNNSVTFSHFACKIRLCFHSYLSNEYILFYVLVKKLFSPFFAPLFLSFLVSETPISKSKTQFSVLRKHIQCFRFPLSFLGDAYLQFFVFSSPNVKHWHFAVLCIFLLRSHLSPNRNTFAVFSFPFFISTWKHIHLDSIRGLSATVSLARPGPGMHMHTVGLGTSLTAASNSSLYTSAYTVFFFFFFLKKL